MSKPACAPLHLANPHANPCANPDSNTRQDMALRRAQLPASMLGGRGLLGPRAFVPAVAAQRRSFMGGSSHGVFNWGVIVVPEQQAYVLEQLGKFHSVLKPGIHVYPPPIYKIAYVHSLKETAIPVRS